jgi:hypothetical protein
MMIKTNVKKQLEINRIGNKKCWLKKWISELVVD